MASKTVRERADRLTDQRNLLEKLATVAEAIADPLVSAHFDSVERSFDTDILRLVSKDPEAARIKALERDAFRTVRAIFSNGPSALARANARIEKLTKEETTNGK